MTGIKTRAVRSIRYDPMVAVRSLDNSVAAVLESKPSVDEVPPEAWWHIAESLHHAIAVRRAREGIARLHAAVLQRHIYEAAWSAQAALARLGEGPIKQTSGRSSPPSIRGTSADLARLIVSARVTPLETLRGALLNHLEALGAPES
jgi:hypothetical protein